MVDDLFYWQQLQTSFSILHLSKLLVEDIIMQQQSLEDASVAGYNHDDRKQWHFRDRFCFHVRLQIRPLSFDCGPENQTSFQSNVHRLRIEFCVHIPSEYLLTTNCCWSQSLQNKLILRWFICILLWAHSMPTCCTKVADTSRGIWTLALNSSREMKRGPQDGNSFKVDPRPSPLSQRGSKVSSSLVVAAGKKFSTGGVSRPSFFFSLIVKSQPKFIP